MNNQFGISQVVLLIIVGLIVVAVGVFGLGVNPFKQFSTSPSASPGLASQGPTLETSEKQQMYEDNKEKIKADLDLSEEEFQVLKRFSAD